MRLPGVEPKIVSRRPLREFVVETNDGIISTAGIVEGMLAAEARSGTVLMSAAIVLVVGSLTTAAARFNEAAYLRDAALEAVAETKLQLAADPISEQADLVDIYVAKGLSPALAAEVATELSAHDALGAHIEDELELDDDDFRSPWVAAALSGAAYVVGGLLPILLSILIPYDTRMLVTGLAVALALTLTSYVGSTLSNVGFARTALRTVGIALATLALAALVGSTFDL